MTPDILFYTSWGLSLITAYSFGRQTEQRSRQVFYLSCIDRIRDVIEAIRQEKEGE